MNTKTYETSHRGQLADNTAGDLVGCSLMDCSLIEDLDDMDNANDW